MSLNIMITLVAVADKVAILTYHLVVVLLPLSHILYKVVVMVVEKELNGGGGEINIIYYGQEEGTTVPGGTTTPAGRYYECDSDGNPIGNAVIANVWQSSTDPSIKEREFGQGTGSVVGFANSAIPYNTLTKIQKYIEFKGSATDAAGKRQLEVGTFDFTQVNKMRFTVIRGSNQNGGENPDQALNVFYKKGTSNTVTLFSQYY